MRFKHSRWLGVLALACAATAALAATPADKAAQARKAFEAYRASVKNGSAAKLGGHLEALAEAGGRLAPRNLSHGGIQDRLRALRAADGYVPVTAIAKGDAQTLRAELVSRGMLNASVSGQAVTGRVPLSALKSMASVGSLQAMRPSFAITNAGLVTSQGDRSMRSDTARQVFNVDGRGVRVGVLSDSYDCLTGPLLPGNPFTNATQDIANGDLPADVKVLKDFIDPSCTDEGRAMMQLIHDVAPGSSLAFYTAFESEQDFANGIVALADAGAKVIVDDVIYFAEPMFLDGVVAQATDKVKARGVAYYSAAGNQARQSYESRFRDSGLSGVEGGVAHDFDPGNGVDIVQSITAQGGGSATLMSFQWDEPWASVNGVGSASDLDIYWVDNDGVPILPCFVDPFAPICQFPGIDANIGGDAVEIPILFNDSDEDLQANLVIEVFDGPNPTRVKYVWFDLGNTLFAVNEFDTKSGTAYGHPNAAGAMGVGAAPWYNTAAFGQNKPECNPACLENFSSAGGIPIFFNTKGKRLRVPEVRLQPGLTGPDGGNTTYFFADIAAPIPGSTEPDGFPNFFGTSAAAPHVAAVAALMLDQRARDIARGKHFIGPKQLSPDAINTALRLSAATQDIKARAGRVSGPFPLDNPNGFDFDSGFGFINAPIALLLTAGF